MTTEEPPHPTSQVQALRRPKGQPDLVSGPIGKSLILFTLPVLGSNALQSLNGTANAAWISHVLGPQALAAAANANNILFLLLGAAFGIAMAANLLIAQAVGAGDAAAAQRAAGVSTTFFAGLSVAVGAAGYLATPAILDLMGAPPDVHDLAVTYLRIIFLAAPAMYFFSFVMMAMRGTGDSRTPFYFALGAVALDIVLNPLLLMGIGPFPEMGIAGSATATLVSQAAALAGMIVYLYRTGSVLVPRRGELSMLVPDLAIIRTLVFKGVPMALHMVVVSGAAVVMIAFVNAYGAVTAAAYGAALQIWTYVQMPAFALGAAVSSMAAQNVGAGRMDRVERTARLGVAFAFVAALVPIVLILAFEPLILRLFLPQGSPSIAVAREINAIALWGFIPFGMAFIFAGVVRATGAVIAPLLAMVISLWVIRIPLAALLEPRFGADAIWWSFPIGSLATLILAGGYYVWGGWRTARLGPAPSPAPSQGPAQDQAASA